MSRLDPPFSAHQESPKPQQGLSTPCALGCSPGVPNTRFQQPRVTTVVPHTVQFAEELWPTPRALFETHMRLLVVLKCCSVTWPPQSHRIAKLKPPHPLHLCGDLGNESCCWRVRSNTNFDIDENTVSCPVQVRVYWCSLLVAGLRN